SPLTWILTLSLHDALPISFHSAHDKGRMKDVATLREREKVKLIPDEQLERVMPLRVAIAEIQLTDGTHLTQRVDSEVRPIRQLRSEEHTSELQSLAYLVCR